MSHASFNAYDADGDGLLSAAEIEAGNARNAALAEASKLRRLVAEQKGELQYIYHHFRTSLI